MSKANVDSSEIATGMEERDAGLAPDRRALDAAPAGGVAAGPLSARLRTQVSAQLTVLNDLLKSDAVVLLARTASDDFEVVASAGAPPVPRAGERLPGGVGSVCAFAAAQQGAVIFDDVPKTARFNGATMATRFGAVSSVVVAIRHVGEMRGVLSVHSRTVRSFTGAEARDIEAAADGMVWSLAMRIAGAGGDHQ